MHFITKFATKTSVINYYKRLVWRVQKQSSEGSPYSTQTITHKPKKTEIGKSVCLFCDNQDYKIKLTVAGEYHAGSNNPNTARKTVFPRSRNIMESSKRPSKYNLSINFLTQEKTVFPTTEKFKTRTFQ